VCSSSKRMALRSLVLALSAACALTAISGVAKADRTYLVGGTVLEGKAKRVGQKVVVEIESGEISLPASAVERIEKGESTVSRFDARYAALRPGDTKARLDLADYCRDHDMRAREHRLLLEVLEIDESNAAARARLGYVKTEAGWATQAEVMRAKGLVLHEGRWVTPAEVRESERLQLEAEVAARRREEADAELAARRSALAAQQAELDAQRHAVQQQVRYGVAYPAYYAPYYRGTYGTVDECSVGRPCARWGRPATAPGPFDTTSLSVVKVPYRRQ
jgi:hypothetical protein